MKFFKPNKVKRAFKELTTYIDASNGIDDREEWRNEVHAWKIELDPKDWEAFEEIVSQLEIMGEDIAEAHAFIDKTIGEFEKFQIKLLKSIK